MARGFVKVWLVVAMVCLCAIPVRAATPSFNCAKAATATEKMLCANDVLAEKDVTLTNIYTALSNSLAPTWFAYLRKDQRRWLKLRDNSCKMDNRADMAECIGEIYDIRIAYLSGLSNPKMPLAERTIFMPGDTPETVVHIRALGRALFFTRSSGAGVAMQMTDKATGPSPVSGQAGQQDGNAAYFMDEGQYKFRFLKPEKLNRPFFFAAAIAKEMNTPVEYLDDNANISGTLDYGEKYSYWLDITKPSEQVYIEAAGRNLNEMRLFKAGNWQVNIAPTWQIVTPQTGRPLKVLALDTKLEKGLYQLRIYGDKPLKWAVETDAQTQDKKAANPFYLTKEMTRLGQAERVRYTMHNKGFMRFIMPEKTDYIRLELDEPTDAELKVETLDSNGNVASVKFSKINKKSRFPVAEIKATRHAEKRVTVTAKANVPFVLQHMEQRQRITLTNRHNYWISSLGAGYGDDTLDTQAMLYQYCPYNPPSRYVVVRDDTAIDISPSKAWRRRFNLTGEVRLFVDIERNGEYIVEIDGLARTSILIEPYLHSTPAGYRRPPTKRSGESWSLGRGYYVLTLKPGYNSIGIADVTLRGNKTAKPKNYSAATPSFTRLFKPGKWKNCRGSGGRYYLALNNSNDNPTGLYASQLPLKINSSFPAVLKAGEVVSMPVKGTNGHTLTGKSDTGAKVSLSYDGKSWAATQTAGKSSRTLFIKNTSKNSVFATIKQLAPQSKKPEKPTTQQISRAIKSFENLSIGQTVLADISQNATRSYDVTLNESGLYRFFSTGLLSTWGNIRSRLRPQIERRNGGGTGRNFLLERYLLPGTYRLQVGANGTSAGHLGIVAERASYTDGGVLLAGQIMRKTLDKGQGLYIKLKLDKTARYRLQARALGRNIAATLEDNEGWPLTAVGQTGDIVQDLNAGEYLYRIAPQNSKTRVIARIYKEDLPVTVATEGHGPHHLALGKTRHHVWTEPAKAGQPRTPDSWLFSLPAAADVSLDVSQGMVANIYKHTGNKTKGKANTHVRLPAGDYRVEIKSAKPDNLKDYTIGITTKQMLPGQIKTLTAPASVPVSFAGGGVELYSFGLADVLATLKNDSGKIIARSDDRENDWNFLIAGNYPAGNYALDIEKAGQDTSQIVLFYNTTQQAKPVAANWPFEAQFNTSLQKQWTFEPPDGRKLVVFEARSKDTLAMEVVGDNGMIIGRASGNAPKVLIGANNAQTDLYTVRLWSVDKAGADIIFNATANTLKPVTEQDFVASGAQLQQAGGVFAAFVKTDAKGLFALANSLGTAWHFTDWNRALNAQGGKVVPASKTGFMLAADTAQTITGKRIVLYSNTVQQVALERAPGFTVDVAKPLDNNISVVVAHALAGAPNVRISGGDFSASSAVADRQAATVIMPGNPASVQVFHGDKTRKYPLQTGLQLYNFELSQTTVMPTAVADIRVQAHKAVQIHTSDDLTRTRISLPQKMAALWLDGDTPQQFVLGRNRTVQVYAKADRLVLMNLSAKETVAGVEIGKVDAGAQLVPARLRGMFGSVSRSTLDKLFAALSTDLPFRRFAKGQRTEFRTVSVDNYDSDALPLGLNTTKNMSATFVGRSGVVQHGRFIDIAENGQLILDYNAGFATAWLSEKNAKTAFGSLPDYDIDAADDKSGTIFMKDGSGLLEIQTKKPCAVTLLFSAPVLVYDGTTQQTLQLDSGATTLFMPQDSTRKLSVFPFASGSGSPVVASFMRHDPILLEEGLNQPVAIAPGSARLFVAHIKETGANNLGFGAGSVPDDAAATLFDATGKVLGTGVVQLANIVQNGKYYLLVETGITGRSLLASPALVGTNPPKMPKDTGQKYKQMSGSEH